MIMRNRLVKISALLMLLTVVACAKHTTIRSNPKHETAITAGKGTAILPPVVEICTLDIAGKKERMYNYELEFEHLACEHSDQHLKELGLHTKIFTRKELHEKGAYEDYLRMINRYNDLHKELYKILLIEESKAFNMTSNLGEPAINLGKKLDKDLLVMVNYAGISKTNGARARDLMASLFINSNFAQGADNSAMIVGFIDAKSGDVLWMNTAVYSEDIYSSAISNFSSQKKIDKDRIVKLLKAITHPLSHKN